MSLWQSMRNRISGGFYVLSSATLVAQAIAALAIPWISRFYSVESFSNYSVVYSISAIAGMVFAGRLDLAVNTTNSNFEALRVMRSAVVFAIISGLVTLFGLFTVRFLGATLVASDYFFIPFIASSMATVLTCNQLAIREKRFKSVATRTVLQAVALCAFQLGLAPHLLPTSGLTIGLLASNLVAMLACVPDLRRSFGLRLWREDFANLETLRRYKSFPITLMPQGLLNALSVQLPIVLCSYVFDDRTTGSLGMCVRILSFPLSLFALAAGQVYVSELGENIRSGSTRGLTLFYSTSKRSLLAGLLMCGILVPFGPALFAYVLGSKWELSGEFARIMAIGVLAQLIAVPVSQTLVLCNRKVELLAWDALRALVIVIAFTAGSALGWGAHTTLGLMSLGVAVTYGATWLAGRRILRSKSQELTHSQAKAE